MHTSVFTLSFDFEIGWGDITNGIWRTRERRGTFENLRTVLPQLLGELDTMELPATWATVGAMIQDPTVRTLDHLPKMAYKAVTQSLENSKSSSFDGRDLFECLLAHTAVGHEIACHSYSHVPFDYEGVDDQFVDKELELAKDAYGKYGLTTNMFVFPENAEAYYETLNDHGFTKARTKANTDMSRRLHYLAGTLVKPPPFTKIITTESGLQLESGSMLFNMGVGKAYRMPFVMNRAMNGLNALVRSKGECLHVWAHPFNFAESKLLYSTYIRFLKKVAEARDRGDIVINVM